MEQEQMTVAVRRLFHLETPEEALAGTEFEVLQRVPVFIRSYSRGRISKGDSPRISLLLCHLVAGTLST